MAEYHRLPRAFADLSLDFSAPWYFRVEQVCKILEQYCDPAVGLGCISCDNTRLRQNNFGMPSLKSL